jgi:hypothetical protein
MEKIIRECKIHGLTEFYVRTSPKQLKYECKICRKSSVRKQAVKQKLQMMKYKGNCCSICGYNKNITALEFHHIDPKTKSFELSYHSAKNWEEIKTELDKCIIVCSNCHKEIHNPTMELALLV